MPTTVNNVKFKRITSYNDEEREVLENVFGRVHIYSKLSFLSF